MLRHLIPRYVQDDPALARVMDEDSADHLLDAIAARTVADLLPKESKTPLPVVDAAATVMEIAAVMARMRSPIVAVVEDETPTASLIGAVSVAHLLELLLPAGG